MLTITAARPDAAKLAVSGLFGKYKPEAEREVRKVEVTEDKVLEQLKAAWKKFTLCFDVGEASHILFYPSMVELESTSYSAGDVEKLSIAIAEFEHRAAFSMMMGPFLSVLINNGRDSDYVIHTGHLTKELHYLGYENTKSITVIGNVGDYLGYVMKGGSITVNGNAASEVGCQMEGGTITVNGNAWQHLGAGMGGGSIIVRGNAGKEVGANFWGKTEMVGGEIHLEGDYESLGQDIRGGKIYHKGVLIVDK